MTLFSCRLLSFCFPALHNLGHSWGLLWPCPLMDSANVRYSIFYDFPKQSQKIHPPLKWHPFPFCMWEDVKSSISHSLSPTTLFQLTPACN